MKWISIPALCALLCGTAAAQTFTITGRILEQRDTLPVIGATVQLKSLTDTAFSGGTVTDMDGRFTLQAPQGGYRLTVSYIGTQPFEQRVTVLNGPVALGVIRLKDDVHVLEDVLVQGQQIRAQQIGDTMQFNAGAFKTNPDASAEDLVTKMPGVTSEDGTVKVQGEEVQQVLVDGKPFFGDDPAAALKNLPAEVVDKIQVFDRLSDQSQFTGFDDGQSQKAINIITKNGRNKGQFGKAYAGYGTDDRYNAGGNINFFDGDRRISVIGLSNNINQQNFSTEDLLGVSAGSGGQGRGGYGGTSRRGGGRGRSGGGGGGRSGGGSNAGNFLVGQQNGITATNSAGINYSDTWGKKINVSGSYFFNATNNDNKTDLERDYFTSADSGLSYSENSTTRSTNTNHRLNFRFEYNIDSANSLLITPRLSFQDNDYTTSLLGSTLLADHSLTGSVTNNNRAGNQGYNLNNNILFRHRFAKKGRTLSVNLGTQLNGRNGDGGIYSFNEYADADTTLLDQRYDLTGSGYTLSGNITYTEPLGAKGQVMANYSPSYTSGRSDKETFDRAAASGEYTDFDTLLSNKYDNRYTTQRGGLSYRFNDREAGFMLGADMQRATLDGQQFFPHAFTLKQSFTNVLPQAMFNYKFDQGQNLRVMYRTATSPPGITQLQNVVDVTNPLLLRTGNPDLKQNFSHTLIFRYGKTQAATARSLFLFAYGNYTAGYIGSETIIPAADTVYTGGIVIRRGSQLTRPVNLDGYWNARTFLTYGTPLGWIKSNLNLNAGFGYSRTPALINGLVNLSGSYSPSAGIVVSSNVSENLDFTLSWNGNYNIVRNTLQTQTDNAYYSHVAAFKINWIFLEHFVLNTNMTHTMYSGLSQGFNQQFLLWNAYAGYKFLKNRTLEARLSVYDLLNQNRSVSRNITDTYLEDTRTQVLTQYFMLSLTYTLRNFSAPPPRHEP